MIVIPPAPDNPKLNCAPPVLEQLTVNSPLSVPVYVPALVKKVGVPEPAISSVPPPKATEKLLETFPVPLVVDKVPEVEEVPKVNVFKLFPNALVKLLIETVPWAIVSDLLAPPKVFVLLKVTVPAPTFVKLFAPETTPLSVVFPDPPTLASDPKATVPAQVVPVPLEFIRAPPLEIPVPLIVNPSVADEVSENPFISKTPLEVIDVPAPVVPNGPLLLAVELAPNLKVPFAFTVVNPVNVFVPESVTEVPEAPPTLTTFAKEVAVELVLIPSEIIPDIEELLDPLNPYPNRNPSPAECPKFVNDPFFQKELAFESPKV